MRRRSSHLQTIASSAPLTKLQAVGSLAMATRNCLLEDAYLHEACRKCGGGNWKEHCYYVGWTESHALTALGTRALLKHQYKVALGKYLDFRDEKWRRRTSVWLTVLESVITKAKSVRIRIRWSQMNATQTSCALLAASTFAVWLRHS